MNAATGARIVPLGPVAAASFVVAHGASRQVTVLVKATFDLVVDHAAEIAAPIDVIADDLAAPWAGPPGAGALALATDLVPYLPGCGVILRGTAHAMLGIPTPAMAARLTVHDAERTLLEKTVHVFGERSHAAPTPRPLVSMPVVYERAFGGADIAANPVGVGAGTTGALPNVVDPADPRRPAGFGPISPHWESRRRRLLGGELPKVEGGVMRLADGVDWRFFHAAPEDQQIPFLRGDECLVLAGLRPEAPRFRSQLPSARGRARFRSRAGGGEIELVADTLAIDAERPAVSIVWRGQLALAEDLVVFLGVERPGRPIAWPEDVAARFEIVRTEPPPPPRDRDEEEPTGPVSLAALGALLAGRAHAPFAIAAPRAPSSSSGAAIPGAPWNHDEDAPSAPLAPVGLPAPPPMLGPIATTTATTTAPPPAEDPEHAEDPGRARVTARLERFESLDGVDAAGADLSGLDLGNKSLIGANLKGSRLDRARLGGAKLVAADLRGASLTDAILEDADLHGADLGGANLKGANLSGAKLGGAKLARATLDGAVLDGAEGGAVDLSHASLVGASLRGAELPGARLGNAKLAGARFDGASLPKVWLVRASGEGAAFDHAKMSGARLGKSKFGGASFRHAELDGANFENAELGGACFDGATLARASLSRAGCIAATFHGADLSRARLIRVSGERADFREASLDLADLRKAQLPGASFADVAMHRARLDRANLKAADFTGADLRGSSFTSAILRDAICSFARFEGADLTDADLREASSEGSTLAAATRPALTRDAEASK